MKKTTATGEELKVLEDYGIDISTIMNPQFVTCEEGEWITEDGEFCEDLFFLYEGTVTTLIPAQQKQGLLIGSYSNRGIFDDTILFRDENRSVIRAVTQSPAKLISLPLELNKSALLSQNAFLIHVSKGFSQFIAQTMNSFYFQKYPLEYLLCSYIAVNRTAKEWIPDWDSVGRDLELSPRAIERCMRLLEDKGILNKGDAGYLIADPILFEEYNKGLYVPKSGKRKYDAES
ncbi:MAG: cyclic nucleotide-binding domain-containing protein [Solobacterium sp.]|nr:cyclic nucleotide-binding domain-containing protein [Solobacterium sp.]